MARAGQQPPGRLPELVGTLRDLARVAGGARLTAGQDLRSLPVEIGVSLRDARTRYGLPATWHPGERLTTVGDVAVLAIRDGAGALVAVLKLARSPAGDAGLRLQQEVLALLAADDRLGEWRRLLPEVLAAGGVARRYTIERAVPGTVGTALPGPAPADGALRAAVAAVAGLHRATGRPAVATRALVDGWLDGPLTRIADLPMVLGRGRRRRLVDDVRRRVRAGLEGRTVWLGRTHGDLTPGNLVHGDGLEVRGILDWAQSREGEPAWLDPVTLLLVARAQRQATELGDVVRALRRGAAFSAAEAALLEQHRAACPGDPLDDDVLALLAWLRHVEGNLAKSPRYAAHPVWVRRNVERVLTAGRSGPRLTPAAAAPGW